LLTPTELVDLAVTSGLDYLALTDHDTVAGAAEFISACQGKRLKGYLGVEISAEINDVETHILGYNIDYQSQILDDIFVWQKEQRRARAKKTVERFREVGLVFDEAAAEAVTKLDSVGRPQLARLVLQPDNYQFIREKMKFDPEQKFAESFFIGGFMDKPGQLLFVDKEKVAYSNAVEAIRGVGGLAFLAHPSEYLSETDFLKIAPALLATGLSGIEVGNCQLYGGDDQFYYRFCLDNNLLMSSGTDFHGRPGQELGKLNLTLEIEAAVLETFTKMVKPV